MRHVLHILLTLAAAMGVGPVRAEWLVNSYNDNRVLRYNTTNGQYMGVLVPSASGGLSLPHDIVIDANGHALVASAANDAVPQFSVLDGSAMGNFVAAGSGGLDYPVGMAYGPDGNLYVSGQLSDTVQRYNPTNGAYIDTFVTNMSGGLDGPSDLTFGPDGHLYVVGRYSDRVHRYNGATGAYIDNFVTNGLSQPFGITFGPDANLYVVSGNGNAVRQYNGTNGELVGTFASTGLSFPIEAEFGPDGNLYVASFNNSRIVRFNGQTGAFIDNFITNNTEGLSGCNFFQWRSDPDPVYEAWRSNRFTSAQLTNHLVSGAGADPDLDTFENWSEYVADTDPQDSASYFPNATNATLQSLVVLQTSTGRTYDVFWKSNLVSTSAWIATGLNQLGTGSNLTLVVTNVPEANHYRTGVRLP